MEFVGGASVQFQLLNPESRRYFNRVFAHSGSALNPFFIRKTNQLQQIQNFLKIIDSVKLIEYLKMANPTILTKFFTLKMPFVFQPTIESSSINGAFLSKTPEDIYNSNEAPAIDTMFSLTTDVITKFQKEKKFFQFAF